MKKKVASSDRLLGHYEFRGGERGKYVDRLRGGGNVVVLDPDVAAAFRDSKAVNRALRSVLRRASRRRRRVPAGR